MGPDHVTADVQELLPDYLEDARECLDRMSQVLLAIDRGQEDPEHVPELFRQAHIIKGGAGLMGFATVGGVAHAAEDLLGAVKKGSLPLSPAVAASLLEAHDVLKMLLDELEAQQRTSTDGAGVVESLRRILAGEETAAAAPGGQPEPTAVEAAAPALAESAGVDQSDEVVREFFVEGWELIDELDQDLVALEETPEDADLLNKIFRAAHTLKGSSSFLGFDKISGVTHRVEDIFNKLRKREMTLTREAMDVILDAIDRVRRLLEAAQEGALGPPVEDVLAALAEVLEAGGSHRPENGGKEVQGEVAPTAGDTPSAAEADGPRGGASATASDAERGPVPAAGPKAAQNEQTIRVDVGRLDTLMNLVGELVLGKNRLARLRGRFEEGWAGEEVGEELAETSAQIDLVASDLQLAVMKTRLVPIDKVFRKFPRMVRDLGRSMRKEMRLEIRGENTELDKSVVEVIGDPLVHLIRNAADHGVEDPDARVAAGKPREGRIRLSAWHEGNHIVVSIEDDGKGMDPEVLKQKAVEKGIINPQEATAMGAKEAFNLIFAPGFSTANQVTSVSGRGVGMDVVKTNIQQLNGLIEIDSSPGQGTRVDVRIPLTLAIIQALLVRVGTEVYAVPLVSVLETVRIQPEDVKTVDRFPVLRLRDWVMPLLRVDRLFGVRPAGPELGEREYVVVLGLAEKRVGLVVDGLVGEEEVVIKSLGDYLAETRGIAGATIRGDGRVTLIVDVNEILDIAASKTGGSRAAA